MHLQGLDLNLLIALDALLMESSVTAAADRIHISQPGMSVALQKLRYHFGDPLLQRVGRNLELTARARTLIEPVKDILARVRLLNDYSNTFDPAQASRIFRISATTYCCELLAGPLILHLKDIDSKINVHFEEMLTDSIDRVLDGRLDFAIMISAGLLDQRKNHHLIESLKLFTDHFVVAISTDHPHVGDTISFDELCDLEYIETTFGGAKSGMGISEQLWSQQPRQPRIWGWLPNFHLTLNAVSHTRMATILPSFLSDLNSNRYNVRSLPVPFEMPILEERLYWHKRNTDDAGHRWMAQTLQRIMASLAC
jgi:DNA-binding transcriptional LysR family regulator